MAVALSALVPSLVMAVLFVALVVVAARATDWSDRESREEPPPPEE